MLESFPTDTSPDSLKQTFSDIKSHPSFKDLKLDLAIYSVKHSSKKPFLEETYEVRREANTTRCLLTLHTGLYRLA